MAYIRFFSMAVLASICAQAHAMPLADVLELAREKHPDIRKLTFEIAAFKEDVVESRAAYLPSLGVDVTAQYADRDARLRDGTVFEDDTRPISVSASASQRLYDGGRRHLDMQIAHLALDVQQHNARADKIDALLNVAELYISAYGASRRQQARLATAEAIEEALAAFSALERAGEASEVERLQTESRLQEVRAQIIQENETIRRASDELTRLLGERVEKFEDAELTEASANDLAAQATELSPFKHAADISARIARLRLSQERRARLPSVDLVGRVSTQRDTSPVVDRDTELQIGVSMNMPLFSGGRINSRTRRAANLAGAAQFDAARAARESAAFFDELSSRRRQEAELLKAREARLDAARRAQNKAVRGYELGVYGILNLTSSIEEVQNAVVGAIDSETAILAIDASLHLYTVE